MSVNTLTPVQPVNKGLAIDIPSIYPDIIGMLDKKKASDLAEEKWDYKKSQDAAKFKMDVAELDYTGLKAKEMTGYQDYATEFINTASVEANSTGESISNMANAEGLSNLKGVIQQSKATNLATKEIYAGNNENGEYWYVDEGMLTPILREKAEAAQVARMAKLRGEEYDATALMFDPQQEAQKIENANHKVVSKKHWKTDEETLSQVYSVQGSGKLERAQLTKFQQTSMLVLQEGSIDPVLDPQGKPIVVEETPDAVVNDIRMNDKKYDESLDYRVVQMVLADITKGNDGEGNPIYYNKKDLIRNDYLEAGGAKTDISNIRNLYQKPTKDTTSEGDTGRDLLYRSTQRGAGHLITAQTKVNGKLGDMSGLDTYLGTLGNSNVTFTTTLAAKLNPDGTKAGGGKAQRVIVAKVRKTWYDKEAIAKGTVEGNIDLAFENIGKDKKVVGDYYEIPIPLSDDPTAIMGKLMNLTGKINKTGYEEVVNQAMDDLNEKNSGAILN